MKLCPLKISVAIKETNPIIAKRPLTFSAYLVKPVLTLASTYIVGSIAKLFIRPWSSTIRLREVMCFSLFCCFM